MVCTSCGAGNAARARFCDQCGAALVAAYRSAPGIGPPAAQASAAPARADPIGPGDRRIVTALFADLVDYSRLVSELDPEEVRRRVDDALRVMAEAVERFGGSLEKFIGDAVFAVFGIPGAHDDDPVRAALCALAIRHGLAQIASLSGDDPLEVRIGLATGEVLAAPRRLAGDRDWALTGEAVMMAARLQQLAEPGEIILDSASFLAARGRLDAESLEERQVRGRARPVRLYRLRGERPQRLIGSSSLGILVGRTAERRLMVERIASCARTGRGGAVVVVGEAGIGKSRLLADVEEESRALGFGWTWTENTSYRIGEPYGYARQFAERIAEEQGVDPGTFIRRILFTDDVAEDETRRLAGAIAAVARDAEFTGWEAEADLAPADPNELLSALLQVVLRLAPRLVKALGPRVIVIDDLQWADRSSLPMIDQMIRATAEIPLVFLVSSRDPELPLWATLPHVTVIELGGLSSKETERLAAAVAGRDLHVDDAQKVHERTGGNPLFVAETVRALLEDGSLVRRGSRLQLVDRGGRLAVPINLRALLGARIDQLSPSPRGILQVASTIGISFTADLLEIVHGEPVDEADLESLVSGALLVEADGQGSWRFRHPLIHDVAYASLLASRRRVLHARLADHLEATEGTRALPQLAQHRAAAGDRDRGIPLLEQAAERAIATGALAEAGRFLHMAADLAPEADAGRLRDRARSVLGKVERAERVAAEGAGETADAVRSSE